MWRKLSADSSAANKFINEFSVITQGYSEHRNFNGNETGLYFRMLPGYTLTKYTTGRMEQKKQKTG